MLQAFFSTYGWGVFSWHTPSIVVAVSTAIATVVYLLHVLLAGREEHGKHRGRARTALVVLAFLSVAVLWPFRALVNLRPPIHHWDISHYYLGAKYFEEIGYDRLYACLAVADREDGIPRGISGRIIRNLEDNTLEVSAGIPVERCKQSFSPSRWAAFKSDARYFRERVPQENDPARWARLKRDHGFTATPMWTSLARAFAGSAPASDGQMIFLVSLDGVLLLGMWVLVWRTFGTVPTCVALIFWATNEPGRFAWTFLAFLRHAWVCALVAGICLLQRGRHAWAGVLMAISTLLSIFPGLIVLALLVREGLGMVKGRSASVSASSKRFLAGTTVAMVAGLAFSSAVAGRGWDSWPAYLEHAKKYAGTTMLNSMGLKTLTYTTSAARFDRLRAMVDQRESRGKAPPVADSIRDAATWQGARSHLYESRKYAYLSLVALIWTLAILSARGQPAWIAAILFASCALITSELPSYYTVILFALAFPIRRAPALGVILLAFSALSRLSPLMFEIQSNAYVFMSWLVLIVVLSTLGFVGRPPSRSRRSAATGEATP